MLYVNTAMWYMLWLISIIATWNEYQAFKAFIMTWNCSMDPPYYYYYVSVQHSYVSMWSVYHVIVEIVLKLSHCFNWSLIFFCHPILIIKLWCHSLTISDPYSYGACHWVHYTIKFRQSKKGDIFMLRFQKYVHVQLPLEKPQLLSNTILECQLTQSKILLFTTPNCAMVV